MDVLGLGHFATALLAIVAGAVVIFHPKGTRFHRAWGRLYLASMLAVNVSALSIYELWGRFGPFHLAALISLGTVIMGAISVWRHIPRKEWRTAHAYWMCWSYAGLIAAAVSESATRYLGYDFGWTVAIATFLTLGAGAMLINRRLPVTLGQVRER